MNRAEICFVEHIFSLNHDLFLDESRVPRDVQGHANEWAAWTFRRAFGVESIFARLITHGRD
jgi:hypothetical protein